MILLVVDTQKLITNDKLYHFEVFVDHVKILIDTARTQGIEVIYVCHDDGKECELTKGKEGYEIYAQYQPMKDEKVYEKTVNSAFRDTGLLEYLHNKNEKDVMIVGLQTDYCIDATVKCGFEHGLHMIIPAFTNTTIDNCYMTGEQSYQYYNEHMWNGRYAECISFEDAVQIMCR